MLERQDFAAAGETYCIPAFLAPSQAAKLLFAGMPNLADSHCSVSAAEVACAASPAAQATHPKARPTWMTAGPTVTTTTMRSLLKAGVVVLVTVLV